MARRSLYRVYQDEVGGKKQSGEHRLPDCCAGNVRHFGSLVGMGAVYRCGAGKQHHFQLVQRCYLVLGESGHICNYTKIKGLKLHRFCRFEYFWAGTLG